MFDTTPHSRSSARFPARWDDAAYPGPERRTAGNPITRWLAQTLDEIDYGMLLLDGDGQLLHANRAARAELDDAHPMPATTLAWLSECGSMWMAQPARLIAWSDDAAKLRGEPQLEPANVYVHLA